MESLKRCLPEFLLRFLSKFHSGFVSEIILFSLQIYSWDIYICLTESHLHMSRRVSTGMCYEAYPGIYFTVLSRISCRVPSRMFSGISTRVFLLILLKFLRKFKSEFILRLHPKFGLGFILKTFRDLLPITFLEFKYSRRNFPRVSPGVYICICIFLNSSRDYLQRRTLGFLPHFSKFIQDFLFTFLQELIPEF